MGQEIWASLSWPEGQHIFRLVVAVVLGGAIGMERELRDKPAGFRTIILICVGACMYTILSQSVGSPDWNSTRIAAQIVSGVGFLGAGVIMRGRGGVFGLTTAATIWAAASIGMGVGFGKIMLSTLGAVVILIALFVLDVIEHWVGLWRDIQVYCIATQNTDDAFGQVAKLFEGTRLRVRKRSVHEDDDALVFDIVAMGPKSDHDRVRMEVARSDRYTLRRS